jgi:hypothetical protein
MVATAAAPLTPAFRIRYAQRSMFRLLRAHRHHHHFHFSRGRGPAELRAI